jgi:hypothetical protein
MLYSWAEFHCVFSLFVHLLTDCWLLAIVRRAVINMDVQVWHTGFLSFGNIPGSEIVGSECCSNFSFYVCLFGGMEFELRAFYLQSRCSTALATLPVHFFFCSIGPWTQGLHLEPPLHQPFFVKGFFQDRVSGTISPGGLRTVIFLISAFWVL